MTTPQPSLSPVHEAACREAFEADVASRNKAMLDALDKSKTTMSPVARAAVEPHVARVTAPLVIDEQGRYSDPRHQQEFTLWRRVWTMAIITDAHIRSTAAAGGGS